MYPRNAASPERIAIGPVVQISDGAVQSSGVSVVVQPQGGSESAGSGTIAYSAASNSVLYTPTQAETNYTSVIITAYKTGCIPASATIVTTASATPGTVLLAPVTHTSAVVPTVTTLTGHTAQTGDSFARIGATGSGLTSLASAANLATVAGYLDTEIADIKAKTDNLPAAPAAVSDIPSASAIADQVWDEILSGHVTGGSAGAALSAATAPTAAAVADAVWEEALGDHSATSGSVAEALAAAGGAGDPWITPLPGSYSSGQAGKIVGDYLNATVSSRATQTSVDDLPTNAELATALDAADDATLAAIAALSIPTATENADALLARDIGSGTGAGTLNERTVRAALRFIRNKWSIAGTTLTVTKEDDSTTAWTGTVTAAPGADPISGNDPA